MATVEVKLPHHRYEVCIGDGLLGELGSLLRAVAPQDRAAIIADANVDGHFAGPAERSLRAAHYNVLRHAAPFGEDHKNLDTVAALYDVLVEAHFERKSPVVALGGGVTGDTVGFVASTYLRGVPFVQCPTTLLAMVDASVGGKVGVNLRQGKNLVGSFYQPVLVVIDTATLRTLPERELRCGLAECVKHGMIRDEGLFTWIEENLDHIHKLDSNAMVELVARNVRIKADVVMADEKEAGERAHLNFGHTFAHAIESTTGFGTYHHGEAVSLGMIAATSLSVMLGRCDQPTLDRLRHLLERIGLPTQAHDLPPTDRLLDAMRLDKKVADGRIRLIIADDLGAVSIVDDVSDAKIATAWDAIRA